MPIQIIFTIKTPKCKNAKCFEKSDEEKKEVVEGTEMRDITENVIDISMSKSIN